MKFVNEITVNQPVEKVFAFFSQPENLPKWNYYITSVEKTTPDISGLGAQYHQRRQADEQFYEVTAWAENALFEINSLPGSKPKAKRTTRFIPSGEATHLVDEFELKTGFPGFLESFARKRVKSAVLENLKKLKKLLEEGCVTLQDGRLIKF